MREGYLHWLVWSNTMVGSVYGAAAQRVPELVHMWPTRSFGGQVVRSFALTPAFALITVEPNGGQMPSLRNENAAPLSGCPISDPLDVFAVVDWARTALGLCDRDSAFVVPMIEVDDAALESLPQEVRRALDAQVAAEYERLLAVVSGYPAMFQPERVVVSAGAIHVHGDIVQGDKIEVHGALGTSPAASESQPHPSPEENPSVQRWWIRPGEPLWAVVRDGQEWRAVFSRDTGEAWEAKIALGGGDEYADVSWDYGTKTLQASRGDLPPWMAASLTTTLAERLPHPWNLLGADQRAIVDALVKQLPVRHWVEGKILRANAGIPRPQWDERMAPLLPRYVRRSPEGTEAYSLGLAGCLASGRAGELGSFLERAVALLRTKFGDDPGFSTYSMTEVLAACGWPVSNESATRAWNLLVIAELMNGGGGSGTSYSMGAPSDIEDIAQCQSLADFLKYLSLATSPRPWFTAPARIPSDMAVETAGVNAPRRDVERRRALVVTAIPVEHTAMRGRFESEHPVREEVDAQGTVYEVGVLAGWEVWLVEIGPGNAGAAAHFERAVHFMTPGPKAALFLGVGGGVKDVALGDIVAATKVYAYESGKDTKGGFLPRPDAIESSYRLQQRARAVSRRAPWVSEPGIEARANVLVAPIAAGEKVVSSERAQTAKFIRAAYSDAVAVEMEGAGFLRAAHAHRQIEVLVVRGISDLLSGKRESDAAGWQRRAAENAAAFVVDLLAALESW